MLDPLKTCNSCECREISQFDGGEGYCAECHEENGSKQCDRCGCYYSPELGANGCDLCENCADDLGVKIP